MFMPTIHAMENGKILCGKKQGMYADIKEWEKPLRKQIDSIRIGGCNKCEQIVASRKEKTKQPA